MKNATLHDLTVKHCEMLFCFDCDCDCDCHVTSPQSTGFYFVSYHVKWNSREGCRLDVPVCACMYVCVDV